MIQKIFEWLAKQHIWMRFEHRQDKLDVVPQLLPDAGPLTIGTVMSEAAYHEYLANLEKAKKQLTSATKSQDSEDTRQG